MGSLLARMDVTRVDTIPEFTQGMVQPDDLGTSWMYVKASGAKTAFLTYDIDKDGLMGAALTTTTAGAGPLRLGIPQVAIADGSWGWVFVGPGKARVSVLASAAADSPLYTTATGGSLDDTATTIIPGLRLTTANGGATADQPCIANKPLGVDA